MSSRNTKRKLVEEDHDGDILGAKQSKTDEDQTQMVSSRSGRARKKSAKVLEMEAFEVEVASSIGKGRKKPVKTEEVDDIVISTPIPTPSVKKSPKSATASRKKGKTVQEDTFTDVTSPKIEVKEEIKQEVAATNIKPESSLKMILTIPTKQESGVSLPEDVMASPSESENDTSIKVEEPKPKSKAKKKTTKKTKAKPVKEEMPLQVVSPTVQISPQFEVKPMTSELPGLEDEIVAVDDSPEENPLVVAEKSNKKKKAPAKKKVKKPDPTGLQPALLNFDPEIAEKMEMLDYSEFVDTVTGMKEEVDVVTEEDIKIPLVPSKKKAPAKKKSLPKTDGKKKSPASVEKNTKGKKKSALNPDKTPKRRTTAYTLWCNNMRKQLMLSYPDSDFAHISRKLAELWQTVSVAEKDQLRRKAKKIQKKHDMGKDVAVNMLPASTHMRSGQQQQIPQQQIDRSRMVVYTQSPPTHTSGYNYKITGNSPIDAAAHLKLLGESLGTIGARLQEHRGQIAVQGSLSVLLDSMMCALGPLMCLTNQVPELNSVPTHIHKRTLDNIAYVMPGIG